MDATVVGALANDLCNDLMAMVASLEILTIRRDLSPDGNRSASLRH